MNKRDALKMFDPLCGNDATHNFITRLYKDGCIIIIPSEIEQMRLAPYRLASMEKIIGNSVA